MRLKFTKADPMGNATVFVWSRVPRDRQPYIARQIMSSDCLCAEQVGFVEKPLQSNTIAQLQMMGGELSVNATLAFAAVLSKRENASNFKIGVSGCNKLIKCTVKNPGNPRICLPLPTKNLVEDKRALIDGKLVQGQIVNLEGISYFLINGDTLQNNHLNYKKELKNLKNQFPTDLVDDAWGLVFYNQNRITPVVYVKDTDTTVQERACGSASLALALTKGSTEIIQPSGEIIKIKLRGNQAIIEGKVKIIAEGVVNVS